MKLKTILTTTTIIASLALLANCGEGDKRTQINRNRGEAASKRIKAASKTSSTQKLANGKEVDCLNLPLTMDALNKNKKWLTRHYTQEVKIIELKEGQSLKEAILSAKPNVSKDTELMLAATKAKTLDYFNDRATKLTVDHLIYKHLFSDLVAPLADLNEVSLEQEADACKKLTLKVDGKTHDLKIDIDSVKETTALIDMSSVGNSVKWLRAKKLSGNGLEIRRYDEVKSHELLECGENKVSYVVTTFVLESGKAFRDVILSKPLIAALSAKFGPAYEEVEDDLKMNKSLIEVPKDIFEMYQEQAQEVKPSCAADKKEIK